MTFQSYKTANLARGTILTDITALSTSLILGTGQGELFPSVYPYLLEINKYDPLSSLENKPVTKRELVKVTNRSGDTFTIVRSAGYCPVSDTALAQTNTAQVFNTGDSVFLANASEIYDDMQTEIANKLNSAGGLRTAMSTWRVMYTNGSGAEVLLPLGAAGLYLRSNGASAIPDRGAPPMDIHGQTLITLVPSDEFAFYDVSGSVNGRTLVSAIYRFMGLFGDGSDGSVVISGTVTLTKDMYYEDLDLPAGQILNPNGYRFFVRGNFTGTGKIQRNGNAGGNAAGSVAGAGATALNQGSLNADLPGGTGGTGVASTNNGQNGSTGTAANPSLTSTNGVAGGAGGPVGIYTGGTSAITAATRGGVYNTLFMPSLIHPATAQTTFGGLNYKGMPSSSGGGSGANNTGTTGNSGGGGGGGGAGGLVRCAVYNWNFTGTVELIGGVGGNGGNSGTTGGGGAGGGAGGGGGNGGILFRIYAVLTADCTKTLTGGAAGTGGTSTGGSGPTAATAGATGVTISVQI